MDYVSLQLIIERCASAADRLIRRSYPNSPTREFVEQSMLTEWGKQLTQNLDRELLAQELEHLFKIGTILEDMVKHVLEYDAHRLALKEAQEFPSPQTFKSEEDAFRYIKRLFAYRLLSYKRLYPDHVRAKIIDALPTTTHTIAEFASYSLARRSQLIIKQEVILKLNDSLPPVLQETARKRMDWLGTQKQLAELFVTLEECGWITAPVPEAIKRAFTKSNTIQQILKPGKSDRSNKRHYPEVFTTEYQSMFSGVIKNEIN